ncbi:chaperonin-containing T-complex member BBS12 [Sphaeramia orbicularis]|nr:Bardet-Biedl syndrome 12 protein [Sphaeramia orbicularis]
MLGSTIINHRQHVGLQKLSALAEITRSSLGPNKNYKFIQDDTTGESTLVCSCFRILESLELTCSVGQVVYETIETHHRVYNTGSGCLLFLAGAWSHAALECLHRGISVRHIISAMSEGMEICLNVCRQCSISIKRREVSELCPFNVSTVKDSHAHQQLTPRASERPFNLGPQKKLKLSRHFRESESPSISTIHASQLCSYEPFFPDIAHIAETLSHGCTDAMNLVVKASQMQSECNQQDIAFDVTKVVTCVLPGLVEEQATVLPGCVVLVPAEQASVAHHLKEQHLKVALIHGDLAATYRHLGYNRPKGIQSVSDRLDLSRLSKEDTWMEKVVTLLLNLEVNVILVSGVASEKVIECCWRRNILVVEKVKASILKAFAVSTGAIPVTYATQLSKHCVGTGLKVSIWRDLSNNDRKRGTAVNITTDGLNCGLVTVILTSSVHAKLQTLEDQFWACAYRLHWALKDKALLPGAGVTEMVCIQHLQNEAEHDIRNPTESNGVSSQQNKPRTPANPYRDVVLTLMADGLKDYICTVMVNTGVFSKVGARAAVIQHLQDYHGTVGDVAAKFSQLFLHTDTCYNATPTSVESSETPAIKTYDNLCVKQEVWRKALDLVFLVLQTDAEVITGVDRKTNGAQEDLMFL